jgi:ribose-phosphate pyrophosphokinase
MNIIGKVRGSKAVIIDDIVDTAGTLTQGAEALKKAGASEVYACCTHPILSGPAIERLNASVIKQLVVTNSVPLSGAALDCNKIVVLSIARLLGEAIKRTYCGESVSGLFI